MKWNRREKRRKGAAAKGVEMICIAVAAQGNEKLGKHRRAKELRLQIARQYLLEVGLSLQSSAYAIAMKQQSENGLTMAN